MVIDALTHILPDEFRQNPRKYIAEDRTFGALFGGASNARTASAADLVAEMDDCGVDKAVVAGYGWTSKDAARIANDYILEEASRSSRLIPFCGINPLWGDYALTELERVAAGGARGVGELHPDTQGLLDCDLALLADFMETARRLKLVIHVHGSEPVGHSYPGKGSATPALLAELVRRFPDNRFIFAHLGGGLPFYALMPEVKELLSNVWFDTAALPFLYMPEVYKATVAAIGTNKILFGSDYPLIKQSRALEHLKSSGLGEWHENRIRSVNLEQLLRL